MVHLREDRRTEAWAATRLNSPCSAKKKFVQLRDGSVEWPEVRKALDEANYNGWGTIEGGSLPLEELNKRFDLIVAGK